MKVALVVILFVFSFCVFPFAGLAFGQDSPSLAAAEAACGPAQVQFDARATKDAPASAVAQPEPGKSLVYVVEVFDRAVNQISRPTLRIGLDGNWVGADKADSYLSFSVDPGEHHLCARWQSHLKQFSEKAAFAGLTADPGKVYYFRARILEGGGSSFSLDLSPVNQDEGKYLVASSVPSVSHPKK